jgi:undecaprenyl phosphate N,N'-diacetylbacillosamine 1-phosphate transferase
MYRTAGKRVIDIVISLIVLFLCSPILLIALIILFFQNNGRVFFVQERPGKNHRAFFIYKLKTMNDKKDKEGKLLSDNERITKAGRIIRKLSIDELPQLFNVLKGEMSLIGPRPLLFKYLPLYSEEQNRRHEVKPGITGWAQVNGRNAISWKRKFELDIYYVDNLSIALDVKIIFMTIKKVLFREGINQSAEKPMQAFNGNN